MTREMANRSGAQLQRTLHRLRDYLRSDFVAGDRLPNEQTLAEKFSVSRATIREAVSRFVAAGVLEKRWGVGTFVCEPEVLNDLGLLALRPGVAAALGSLGGEISIHFDDLKLGSPDVKSFPDFPDSCTATLERVYAVDDTPAVYTRETMIAEYLDRSVEFSDDWTKSLVPDLLGNIGVSVDRLKLCLTSRLSADVEARRLNTDVGRPVLVASGQALDQDERTFVQVTSVVRTDVVRMVVSSTSPSV